MTVRNKGLASQQTLVWDDEDRLSQVQNSQARLRGLTPDKTAIRLPKHPATTSFEIVLGCLYPSLKPVQQVRRVPASTLQRLAVRLRHPGIARLELGTHLINVGEGVVGLLMEAPIITDDGIKVGAGGVRLKIEARSAMEFPHV